jgi:hypothetical protein
MNEPLALVKITPRRNNCADIYFDYFVLSYDLATVAVEHECEITSALLALFLRYRKKGARAYVSLAGHFERMRAEDAETIKTAIEQIFTEAVTH